MNELTYTIVKDLGQTSWGQAYLALYEDGNVYVRIDVPALKDTKKFRELIRFLHTYPQDGVPKIVFFGASAGNTVLVITPIEGESLQSFLRHRTVTLEMLDKWWNSVRKLVADLQSRQLVLGTLDPKELRVTPSGQLQIPIFLSAGDTTGGVDAPAINQDVTDFKHLELLFQRIAKGDGELACQESARGVATGKSRLPKPGPATSSSRKFFAQARLPGKKWVPSMLLGFALVASGLYWGVQSMQISGNLQPEPVIAAQDTEEPKVSSISDVQAKLDEGESDVLTSAVQTIKSPVPVQEIDTAYAQKVILALCTVRDHAINNLDSQEFNNLTVLDSPAAQAESALFAKLLNSGKRVKDFHSHVGKVHLVEKTKDHIKVSAQLGQGSYLQCLDTCQPVPERPAQTVEFVLSPSPWRVREIVR